ncbi:MAG: glycosyltransferase family 4 protein [Acidimicrobiia bacterium]
MIPRRRSLDPHERLRDGPLRVAIVAESFLPAVNGVTNSVLRTIEHLRRDEHDVVVIAPGPGEDEYDGTPVIRVRSFDLPRYDDLRVALPQPKIGTILRRIGPDVIHLAAPTVLGAAAVRAARRAGIATVAVFQTDIAGFARRHGLHRVGGGIWNYLRWVHTQADRTLAPSTATMWALRTRGIPNVELWGRGVDVERFHPGHRSPDLHRFLAPEGEVVVGYVGRLAKEKQVERLAPVCDLPGVRVVVVGDGPEHDALAAAMPSARFLGFRTGAELSQLMSTLDVFVHTGIDETFCQTLQEAMASGVATVAPSTGGPLDLLRHRETGFFWSPEAPETLEGAVAHLAGDAALRASMGAAGRADAEQRPWSTVMEQLVTHYREVAVGAMPRAERARAAVA